MTGHTPGDGREAILPRSYFERSPLEVAPDLLGCLIASTAGGSYVSGVIVETEAYLGHDDPGSHAATKGVTPRNAVMYGPPGTVYVYFTYGNHYMLNLVCEPEGIAGAVLIRALEPVDGIETMTERRQGRPLGELCNGPGKLARALGIDSADNGGTLGEGRLTVYAGTRPDRSHVLTSGRIGLRHGHDLPYRYFLKESVHISRAKPGQLGVRTRRSGRGSE